jgi:hypothetical protein
MRVRETGYEAADWINLAYVEGCYGLGYRTFGFHKGQESSHTAVQLLASQACSRSIKLVLREISEHNEGKPNWVVQLI